MLWNTASSCYKGRKYFSLSWFCSKVQGILDFFFGGRVTVNCFQSETCLWNGPWNYPARYSSMYAKSRAPWDVHKCFLRTLGIGLVSRSLVFCIQQFATSCVRQRIALRFPSWKQDAAWGLTMGYKTIKLQILAGADPVSNLFFLQVVVKHYIFCDLSTTVCAAGSYHRTLFSLRCPRPTCLLCLKSGELISDIIVWK